MAKTYIDTVKYMVKGNIEINGIVEKPDIVGAIFGQTEGLLGEELDLRELQKSGRIGRIEVDTRVASGKTLGTVLVPSSLDKTDTAVIAAALETVDRVGPCEAKIVVTGIEDTRSNKRDFVMKRAKELLISVSGEAKEAREITEEVKEAVKMADVIEYGPEKLAAGPDVESSEEIIVVEGRADVLNLLKYGINNAICLSGTTIPKAVVDLSKRKSVTMFVDGDRGGDLVVRQMIEFGKVDFVTKAPDGKEVEELTQKEILKCLKSRMPLRMFEEQVSTVHAPRSRYEERRFERGPRGGRGRGGRGRGGRGRGRFERGGRFEERGFERRGRYEERPAEGGFEREAAPPAAPSELRNVYDSIKGSMKAVLLDSGGKTLAEVPVAEMISALEQEGDIDSVVFDGIITQRLVDLASSKHVKTIVGLKEARIEDRKGVRTIPMG